MKPSVRDIVKASAQHFGIQPSEIMGRKRDRKYSWPRQVSMYLARAMTGLSLPAIAKQLGSLDHSTILHGCRAVERAAFGDEVFRVVVGIAAEATAFSRARADNEREIARQMRCNQRLVGPEFKPVSSGTLVVKPPAGAPARRVMVPYRVPERPRLLPSLLAQPTKARLMAGRA